MDGDDAGSSEGAGAIGGFSGCPGLVVAHDGIQPLQSLLLVFHDPCPSGADHASRSGREITGHPTRSDCHCCAGGKPHNGVGAEEIDFCADERAVHVQGAAFTSEADGKHVRGRLVPKGKEQDVGSLENLVQGLLVRDFPLGSSHWS